MNQRKENKIPPKEAGKGPYLKKNLHSVNVFDQSAAMNMDGITFDDLMYPSFTKFSYNQYSISINTKSRFSTSFGKTGKELILDFLFL